MIATFLDHKNRDVGTLRSYNGDVRENVAEKRLRILSFFFFAIIPRGPVTYRKGIWVGAEEKGAHPRSNRDGRIYRLAVPVPK